MKLFKKSIYALSLVSMMGLWSCSSDLDISEEDVPKYGDVEVSIKVSRNDSGTRTELSENSEGGLKHVWTENDQLHVYDKNGNHLGSLTLTDGKGTSVGTFSGTLNTNDEGVQEYRLWYYKAGDNISVSVKNGQPTLKVDISSQNYSNMNKMSAMDILSQDIKLSIKNKSAAVVEQGDLNPHLAFARFSMKDLPADAKGYLNIYDVNGYVYESNTGEEYYNTVNCVEYNLIDGTAVTSSSKEGITISNLNASNDVYVAFIPGNYKFGFKYKDLNDDTFYTHRLENDNSLSAGFYYCKLQSGTEASVTGISIPLKEKADADNPLTKWTKTNLERKSSSEYYKAKFAKSYKDNGDYYQFGRNVGFKDYEEANKVTYVYKGKIEKNFYNGRGTGTKVPTFTTSNLKTANVKKAFLTSWTDDQTDWWPAASKPSDTWEERAVKCGYNPDDMFVIDGVRYRLPDVNDVKQILPQGGLEGELDELKEIKTVNNKSVACRFKKVEIDNVNYYQVKAKVLKKSNSDEVLEYISWDQDEDVATRYFKASSYIMPCLQSEDMYYQSTYYGNVYYLYYKLKYELGYNDNYISRNYNYGSTGYYAFASPWGLYRPVLKEVNGGVDVEYVFDANYNDEFILGIYWMTIDEMDTDNAYFQFRFNPNNYGNLPSVITAALADDHCAFPIRLVRAE